VAFLVLTALVLLAILGGIAGIWIERQRDPSRTARRNSAMRDALFPIAGWGSLFVLDSGVTLIGEQRLPLRFKHLLGTLAVLIFYYAVLATLRLIYFSTRRILARLRSPDQPPRFRPLPFVGHLAFPLLFVSAVFATLSVLLYDGFSLNLVFIACILALAGILRSTRGRCVAMRLRRQQGCCVSPKTAPTFSGDSLAHRRTSHG
jgi:hypothetical protein